MSDYRQQQENEELHRETLEALQAAWRRGLNPQYMSLLCWHCGVPLEEVTEYGSLLNY